jgi:hypothetical protein
MTAATCGDFLRQADAHIRAAAAADQDYTTHPDDAVRGLRQVVVMLAKYLDDQVPIHEIDITGRTDLATWGRAAVDAHAAIRQAADSLSQATPLADGTHTEPTGGPAGHLAAAAASLDAGRDLLHTHATISPDDVWEPRSEWAHVVISSRVSRALMGEVARWSRQLAPLPSVLAAGTEEFPAVCGALQSAAHWLWMAEAAIRSAQATEPTTANDVLLLHAIPAARAPVRRPPIDNESAAELCAGVTISAERLRAALFGTAERARWAPTVTADTWRWTARAAAITTHASQLLLRSLAEDLGQPARAALDEVRLTGAADAVAQSLAAWRQVGSAWNHLTTETRGHNSSALGDIGDLVLRIGRLAWDDPQWTPATAQATRRPAADLTGHHLGLRTVLGAIHQAADALACVAAWDREAVQIADRVERLYVRTRLLPQGYDVPRPYATAPTDWVQPLLNAYAAAEQASAQAADVLGALAITVEAPSKALALARTAARRHRHSHSLSMDESWMSDTPVADQSDTSGSDPGPVELAVRYLRVSDPAILRRAAEIDSAAQTLITQAQRISRHLDTRADNVCGPAQRRDPAAAKLAARDNPRPPAPRRSGTETATSAQAALPRPHMERAPRTLRSLKAS